MLTRPSVVVRATHKNFIVSLKRSSEKLEKQYTVHHQQSMQTIFWKFELLIENSRETSIHSTKSWATFQAPFRQRHWYFEEVKTIAVSKIHGQFVQVSFPLKIHFFSPLFVEIRWNSLWISALNNSTIYHFFLRNFSKLKSKVRKTET